MYLSSYSLYIPKRVTSKQKSISATELQYNPATCVEVEEVWQTFAALSQISALADWGLTSWLRNTRHMCVSYWATERRYLFVCLSWSTDRRLLYRI